ncbi:MAG: hypothetical protein R3C03_07795 [Pirellulaceae bacterium]
MKLFSVLSVLLTFLSLGSMQARGQDSSILLHAIKALEKANVNESFVGDEVGADVTLTEIRHVGCAKTGSGERNIFVLRFTGQDAYDRSIEIVRVAYLDANDHVELIHAIGCGSTEVSLTSKDDGSVNIKLGTREYKLDRSDWKQPLIDQQNFC